MKPLLLAATLSLGALASTAEASHFRTMPYIWKIEVTNAAGTLATGSFAFDPAATGIIGFDDLTAFSLTIGPVTYTLADLAGLTNFRYFAFDTETDRLLDGLACSAPSSCVASRLSATNGTLTNGFFFSAFGLREYSVATSSVGYTSFSVTAVPVPAPAALGLFGVGLLGLGLARRRA